MKRGWQLWVLAVMLIVAPMLGAVAAAQTALTGTVVDPRGLPVAGARLLTPSGERVATTGADGGFTLPAAGPDTRLMVEAEGFATTAVTFSQDEPARVTLQPAGRKETVEVTAYRTPLSSQDSPVSTRVLSSTDLKESASPALDNKLRQIPGLELFRRSSSLNANPSSQGLSLRGLGSTAASRTLLVADDVPQLDPYGGWIHWEEMPELSIASIEVVRGGASDLYGSSAIGGVVNFIPTPANRDSLVFLGSYGSLATMDDALLASGTRGKWSALATGGVIRTDGFIITAPDQRGAVDIPSNVHAQNGVVDIERSIESTGRAFLRGSVFNEDRSNGTVVQENETRLWRYSTGVDWPVLKSGTVSARVYGSDENFRQTFSVVGAGRNTEALNRIGLTPAQELGAVAHWTQPVSPRLLFLVGADTHDVRATDFEQSYSTKTGLPTTYVDTSARQRQTGVYGEALWLPSKWTLSASARVDHFVDMDALQWTGPPATPNTLPRPTETVFNPRAGVARRILPSLSLTASAFRAYRAPTQNELYRTGQVGSEVTAPNPDLKSERATGWEVGAQTSAHKTTARASYFWTQVNRPIVAVVYQTTPTQILDKRQNEGQIESKGVAIDFDTQVLSWFNVTGGYQYADATVTKSVQNLGNWIPQVAHNAGTLQVRLSKPRLGTLSLQGRISGHQFDDAANTYLLHGYFRLDGYASHDIGSHIELFAAAENLFDRAIEVGRTPTLTLGTPLVARGGLRLRFGD